MDLSETGSRNTTAACPRLVGRMLSSLLHSWLLTHLVEGGLLLAGHFPKAPNYNCRVVLEVDQTSGSTYLRKVDWATGPPTFEPI